jgi:hypothetical protein
MRTHWIVLSFVAISGGCGFISPTFSQEYRGTWQQQTACTPDVMRLCGDRIPDVRRIVACLRQNTDLLSNACRAVFESDGYMPPQAARRAREMPPRPYDRYGPPRQYDRYGPPRPYDPGYYDEE